ncbi:hypothetical protein M427DRAFT_389307 [Gonapodya prolifera JEL478]|uniref:GDP-fucose protein O-fucosyltransferase 2 n=1 Tax=Gonapodya prolifera (strain JEL478) TaxID=1344416 RepID=A0A139A7R8_GONPJ|nr:hypothetical protein M427DRAFT_389307 [Gonapodya prolifera JEL478]|eukprot:KXS12830.1 hypothetical protein M427DRAFT_389307 [Gonapodya prolifera JEL478]
MPPSLFRLLPRIGLILILGATAVLLYLAIPPSYSKVRKVELERSKLFSNGFARSNTRFVLFINQYVHVGFNNQLLESILLQHFAQLLNRTYVFHPYVWSPTVSPFVFDRHPSFPYFYLRPSRLPLSAFVSGPLIDFPDAVTSEAWEQLCDAADTALVEEESWERDTISAQAWWTQKLLERGEKCLAVRFVGRKPFGFEFFDDPSFPSVYQSLAPFFRRFSFSHIVQAAAERVRKSLFNGVPPSHILVVHFRRGDFTSHCTYIEEQRLPFSGVNNLADPSFDSASASHSEFRRRCYPTPAEASLVIQKAIKESKTPIEGVYISTDAQRWEIEQLSASIVPALTVRSSRDLTLGREEKHVAVAIDMAIAEMSGVFVGNGWSTLTATVVMLRLAIRDSDSLRNIHLF